MDEQEKQAVRSRMDRIFMWGYGKTGHLTVLAIVGLGGGSTMFYFMYGVLKQLHPEPFSLWFLAIEWAIGCGFMGLLGEGMWRVSRYIDTAQRDSWTYMIINGINPYGFGKRRVQDKKD